MPRKFSLLTLLMLCAAAVLHAQSADMATTIMRKPTPPNWTYDQGVILEGIAGLWKSTGDGNYFRYIQQCMDAFVDEQGNIRTYKSADHNIDHVKNGRLLLLLYKVTGQEKYRKAADVLREQLRTQPRTGDGGFWHKRRYPYQMWLDGLYMGEPFYAEYAALFHEDTAFNDITRQFVLMEKHARDSRTGLLYHAWDESRQQRWADKTTGRSPNFWGRAMGWYGMALVDVLDYFPADHKGRDTLIAILNRFAAAAVKYQDPASGVWWQVLDKGKEKGNYLEASASCMFVYALEKGVRKGYLPESYRKAAVKGFAGIQKQFITRAAEGGVDLHGVCSVAGLGGEPYRDGSYAYYLSEKVVVNDPKGAGAYMLAAHEMEMLPTLGKGKGLTVTLDQYFNNEWRKGPNGGMERFHYVWNEVDNNGYSLLGHIFRRYGVATDTLSVAPTAANLQHSNIYIITDPDTQKETASPHNITAADAAQIYNWVKAGGVLVILENDSANAELQKINLLTERFGIHFNEDSRNRVQGKQFEMGALAIPAGHAVFNHTKKVYIKELSTQELKAPATAVYKDGDHVVMSVAHVGKGTVFAVGDPWFYNEYLDGRKLPAEYENYQAATDLVNWLVQQAKKK
ncbi:glycoside hydrolase family 88 protein [Chitinophaga agrisoli]|uniref:Glycoside hydrolase family 88 protein n=1 Tax=Chitinophaga agrisoli TaxID=2607653 RepID=A0A5B2VNY8_9BACT|nr:glycoside hydrolase family 88 protein [Chitinophaga agrisoli]KAA2240022.1 glycoside hydrolase family 88 protein [Chitinophaga agrisoli]